MKIFLGKISNKIDTEQIEQGYYKAPKDSNWIGGIKISDYAFVVGGKRIQLWKAKEWAKNEKNEDILKFDILIQNVFKNTKQFSAFKYFKLNTNSIIFPIRSAKKAFFELELIDNFTEEMLLDQNTYNNPENYRGIKILSSKELIDEKLMHIQMYKNEYSEFEIFESYFWDKGLFDSYVDNTSKIGGGQSDKDSTIKIITDKNNINKIIPADQLSIIRLYDLFFCKYKDQPTDDEIDSFENIPINQSINSIFYGPPATGKTFLTKEHAVNIIEGGI